MDRLKVWLIPGLVALLALGALFYFRGQLPDKAPTTGDAVIDVEVEVVKKPKGFAKPVEPTAQEKAEEDATAMTTAVRSGDLSACASITWDKEMKEQCEDNLNYAAGIKTSDEALCKALHNDGLKEKCLDKVYMSAAVDANNIELCEKIEDPSLKQMCLDQVSAFLARNARSVTDCAVISSELLRKQCEDRFYLKISANTLEVESCDNISNPQLADQCRKTVTRNIEVRELSKKATAASIMTKTSQEILDMCNSLTGDKATLCKDAVYPQVAFDKKDVSYCNQMSNVADANKCIQQQGEAINTYLLRQAIAANDKTLCDQISDNDLKNVCKSS